LKELQEIVKAFNQACKDGKRTALATVVLVEGSAYRRAGARMLITEDGQLTGAISGGCLEGDALRKARLVIMQQEPMLVTYDTMDDDDAKLGVGLGCNGIIHILIEPVNETGHNPVNLLKSIVEERRDAVLVTLFALSDRKLPQPGTCLYLNGDTIVENGLNNMDYRDTLLNDAEKTLEKGHSDNRTYTDGIEYTAFIEYIKPVISLVIIGAGNDAVPLTQIAAILGWDITVIDGRPNYALPQRFPLAANVITAKPLQVLQQVTITGQTAFVLMTHNFNYEFELLKELLPLPIPYIGVLGPKKKLNRMLGELEDNGFKIMEEQLRHIYGPIGLDIGSEGAEEIALSIIAEIKAVFSARNGQSLKYKPVPIHTTALSPVTG
jgi:xanthine dehydrogenase accessory factor